MYRLWWSSNYFCWWVWFTCEQLIPEWNNRTIYSLDCWSADDNFLPWGDLQEDLRGTTCRTVHFLRGLSDPLSLNHSCAAQDDCANQNGCTLLMRLIHRKCVRYSSWFAHCQTGSRNNIHYILMMWKKGLKMHSKMNSPSSERHLPDANKRIQYSHIILHLPFQLQNNTLFHHPSSSFSPSIICFSANSLSRRSDYRLTDYPIAEVDQLSELPTSHV